MPLAWQRVEVPCPRCEPGAGVVKQRGSKLHCFHCKQDVPASGGKVVPLRKAVPNEAVEQAHRALLASAEGMAYLRDERGLKDATIKAHRLGLVANEVQLPYPDGDGGWLAGKRLTYDKKAGKRKLYWLGEGAALLYGLPVDVTRPVLLCEGEWDALLARDRGFNAYSTGAGAGTFKEEWAKLFVPAPSIFIVYDVDDEGVRGAAVAVQALLKAGCYQGHLHTVRLPLSGTKSEKDLTDWFKLGHTAKELEALLAATPSLLSGILPEEDTKVYPADIHESGTERYVGKWCRFRATVTGATEDPWLVPTELRIDCQKDTDLCRRCKVWKDPKPESLKFNVYDVSYLDLISTPLQAQIPKIRSLLGIPSKCPSVSITPEKSQNIWEVRLSEQFRLDARRDQHLYHALSLGVELKANETYELEARVVADPRNQLRAHVIRKATESESDLTAYRWTASSTQGVQRKKGGDLGSHVDKLLADAERITARVERPDLHFLYLQAYLSAQWLQWDERTKVKGWLDVCVIGDSSEGKTTTAEALRDHIGLGDIVSLKRTTEKALIGGHAEERGKSWINWGVDPRNDERLLFYDEVKGATTATLATLTSARSSGWAEVATVRHHQRTHARVRRVWLSNLRGGSGDNELHMASIVYPVIGLPKLFGALEDVRRLDAALGLLAGEVGDKSKAIRSEPKILSKQVLHNLVMRAWTLPPVALTQKFKDACTRNGASMEKVYSAEIPLVATDQREKLARLGVALANLLVEDPAAEHVDYVAAWLDKVYSSKGLGYREWSDLNRQQQQVYDKNVVRAAIRTALGGAVASFGALCHQLLSRPIITSAQFKELFADRISADIALSTLVLQNAFRDSGKGWIKTEGFAELLREWSKEKR